MLVFTESPDGHPKCAGICDLHLPEGMQRFEHVNCMTPKGMRQYRLGDVAFASRPSAAALIVLRLAKGDDPQDLPNFRQAEGWA